MFDTDSLTALARTGKVCGTCYESGHVYHEIERVTEVVSRHCYDTLYLRQVAESTPGYLSHETRLCPDEAGCTVHLEVTIDPQTIRPIAAVVNYLSQGDGFLNDEKPLDRDAVRRVAKIRHLPDGGQEIRVPLDFYDSFR